MNNKKNEYPIGEQLQSASPDSQIADELAEKKRNQKKSLIKLGAMGILIAATIAMGSLSWFTQNRTVNTTGMGVSVKAGLFELKAIENGKEGLYDERILGASYATNNQTSGSAPS
nr:hypothetical protein [Eubacterium sp.]